MGGGRRVRVSVSGRYGVGVHCQGGGGLNYLEWLREAREFSWLESCRAFVPRRRSSCR